MKGDREQCIAAGMDDYVSKPIRAEHLFAAIDRALSRFPPPAVEAEAATPADGLPVIDFELALKSVDGDPELLLGIIDAFLEECPLLVDRIRESIVTADAAVLQRSAHTLKGGLQTLAAPAPAELAKQLEHLGREGRPKEGEPLLAALRKALVPVSQTLVEYLGRHRPSKGTSELAVNRSS
jgi:HPt (histidine-containing phosphotransfer) domain-containing protein